ncbi:hypothetical protein N473_11795 [Pseudoalteromonas luteoviolacea CPMOR-1]|uniref:DUF4402 domain-containing protein n=2 Tax=Pseudoalteromonas luteoviolacea TaxID=43657 RepID=A0A167M2J8_9GAMM|nr:DUF4402 domain-containing protein [Pseudoalteromonas luteoviolacea]KID58231.1 hypothetical protein JF50_05995 [Pseudoalteromonas luteoviolacea]KZN65702.1 hypothetical protein N473_11795 [Pseudoalteromonas luteoviolacea CPMOR-1]
MKKSLNQLALFAVIAGLPLCAAATQKATFDAKVTVKNAFELVKNQDLDFGTIRAVADNTGTDTATLTIPADATQSPTVASTNISNAEIAILSAGSPAQFKISGVVPFASLSITDPVETDVSLSVGSGTGAAGFTLGSFTYYIETGASSSTPVVGKQIQVDANGEAVFNVGATLSTTTGNAANYLDGAYVGTFTLELSY